MPLITAGKILCGMIETSTRCSASELFSRRLHEYQEKEKLETNVETFVRILLCSAGKRSFDEPDHEVNYLELAPSFLSMNTMIYMTAMLPTQLKLYKDVVQNYPMD